MEILNIHEAKTHLSRLLERVAQGEQIVIARNGQPIAKLVPIAQEARQPGRLADELVIANDFDDPLPERMARAFRGESR